MSCFQDKQILDMNPKLLYVETNNQQERTLLEEEFLSQDSVFIVPTTETESVQSIVRAICFQHFQNTLPVLAHKVLELTNNALQMKISLTLLHDIFYLLSQQHSHLKNLKLYFQEMNQLLTEGDPPEGDPILEIDKTISEDKDYLFEEAEKGEIRMTRLLQIDLLSDEIEENCKEFIPVKTVTVETQETLPKFLNPQQKGKEEQIQRSNNLVNFFSPHQPTDDCLWWKNQRYVSDESKQLSQFEKKGEKVINQRSITQLLLEQMRRDLNREIELGRDIQKHQEGRMARFNKMMKGKLVSAKIKKKGKK